MLCLTVDKTAACSALSVSARHAQIMTVNAPWVKSCHSVDDGFYAIPTVDKVILGSKQQPDTWDSKPRLLVRFI